MTTMKMETQHYISPRSLGDYTASRNWWCGVPTLAQGMLRFKYSNFLSRYLDQETAKRPFRFSGQAATSYYLVLTIQR